MGVNDVQSRVFCQRHQQIGGRADKRPTYHSGVVRVCIVQLKGTTNRVCIMIGTTPEVIKVPKGAVFIRVKKRVTVSDSLRLLMTKEQS